MSRSRDAWAGRFRQAPAIPPSAIRLSGVQGRHREAHAVSGDAAGGGDMAFGLCQLGRAASSLRRPDAAYKRVDWLANNFGFTGSLITSHNAHSVFNIDLAGGMPRHILPVLVQAQAS